MNDGLTYRVVCTAEQIEVYDSIGEAIDDMDPVDVTAEVSLESDTYRNITLTIAVGGPRIDVNVSNGTVTGH